MITVTYKGQPVTLGRFGMVESGQKIRMTSREWETCNDSEEFSNPKKDSYAKVKPVPTADFDLRRLAGKSDKYLHIAVDSLSVHSLSLVIRAINTAGGKLNSVIPLEMRDDIICTAEASEWSEYSQEDLQSISQALVDEGLPEVETDGSDEQGTSDGQPAQEGSTSVEDNVKAPEDPTPKVPKKADTPPVKAKPPTRKRNS